MWRVRLFIKYACGHRNAKKSHRFSAHGTWAHIFYVFDFTVTVNKTFSGRTIFLEYQAVIIGIRYPIGNWNNNRHWTFSKDAETTKISVSRAQWWNRRTNVVTTHIFSCCKLPVLKKTSLIVLNHCFLNLYLITESVLGFVSFAEDMLYLN